MSNGDGALCLATILAVSHARKLNLMTREEISRRIKNRTDRTKKRIAKHAKKLNPTAINFEINATYKCNASCIYCNRLIDIFRIPNSAVTVPQVREAMRILKEHGVAIRKLKFSGGDASLNPDLVEIVQACVDSGVIDDRGFIRVLTNGIAKRPALPGPSSWIVDPILPGNTEYKNHSPFLLSPDDHGIKSPFLGESCSTANVCGSVFEAFGFTFCGIAGALGRLLKVNPYSDKPTRTLNPDICKHCIYSLTPEQRRKLEDRSKKKFTRRGGVESGGGDLDYPSPTWAAAIKDYKENKQDRMVFPRMFDEAKVEVHQIEVPKSD